MRSGGYFGSGAIGVARSAPRSNSSFCSRDDGRGDQRRRGTRAPSPRRARHWSRRSRHTPSAGGRSWRRGRSRRARSCRRRRCGCRCGSDGRPSAQPTHRAGLRAAARIDRGPAPCEPLPPAGIRVRAVDDRFLVTGGARFRATCPVAGAKNSVLKLMAAALLAEGTTVITNAPGNPRCPADGATCCAAWAASVELSGDRVRITTPAELSHQADFPAVGRLRASVCVLGPLMGRCHRARVALPGGDAIGSRPLDMHQSGLRALGATIEHRARHGGRRGGAAAWRADRPRLPQRRCDREHPDGRGAGRRAPR